VKIAFFADSYKPYLSGVTIVAENLVKDLRNLGHKVYVFAPGYPGHIDEDPDIFRFPSFAGGYPKFRLAIPIVRQIPEIDIVHSHSPFQAGLLARFVARQRNVPFVYSFHTLFTRYVHFARFVPKGLAKMGIIAYLQSFCQGADQIVTPSKMAKRVLLAWKVKKPIAAISFGVDHALLPSDPSAVRKALRSKWGIAENEKVLLYAGRLSKEKNIPFLLEAFHRLGRKDVRLVLIGGGPLEQELRRKNHKHILLVGEVNYPEILSYYCMGDIFVFSSLSETQGLVLAEAKAAGLPIVALFAGGLVETVRSGTDGYLTERNLSTFTGHITRLLDDDALRLKMGTFARKDAVDRFSSFNVAKKFETLYTSLIHKKG